MKFIHHVSHCPRYTLTYYWKVTKYLIFPPKGHFPSKIWHFTFKCCFRKKELKWTKIPHQSSHDPWDLSCDTLKWSKTLLSVLLTNKLKLLSPPAFNRLGITNTNIITAYTSHLQRRYLHILSIYVSLLTPGFGSWILFVKEYYFMVLVLKRWIW